MTTATLQPHKPNVFNGLNSVLQEELEEIRSRLVSIASRRKVSVTDIISLGIVFTKDEIASALVQQPHYSNELSELTKPRQVAADSSSYEQRTSSTAPTTSSSFTPTAVSNSRVQFPQHHQVQQATTAGTGGRAATDTTMTSLFTGVAPPPAPPSQRSASPHNHSNSNGSSQRGRVAAESDVISSRHRALPPGHQLRPGLPVNADESWLEDEERRQSIPAHLKKQYQASVNVQRSGGSSMIGSAPSAVQRTAWALNNHRPFGIEMETYLPKRSDEFLLDNAVKAIRDVAPGLRAFLGPTYDVQFMDYNNAKEDRMYSAWKITTDLSIKSEDGRPIFGLEFITPKLAGPVDLWKLENFCEQLQSMAFHTNTTTALHVHVSAEDLTNYEIMRVCQYMLVFEHIFDMFMTLPRRADYSRYCRSNLKSLSISRNLEEALQTLATLKLDRSIGPLIHAYCPRLSAVRNSHRNHKVNLLLLNRTALGTPGRRIEFRQHQGSIDKVEVGAWVTLMTNWVGKTSKLPPPRPSDGTLEKFWEIVDDPKLKAYYTVKSQTLPSSMTFTYDSRELYSYDSGEEESSDIDDGSGTESPAAAPSLPARNVAVAPSPARHHHNNTTTVVPTPPSTSRLAPSGREADNTPVGTLPAASHGSAVSFMSPPQAANGGHLTSSSPFDADDELSRPSVAENVYVRPVLPTHNIRMAPPAGAGANPGDLSYSGPAPIGLQTMQHYHKKRSDSIAIGNFVLPFPVHLESQLRVEDGESWEDVTSSDPEVICRETEDLMDSNHWFITSPQQHLNLVTDGGPTRGGRVARLQGIRWVSPWVLEAKKLETANAVIDSIKDRIMIENEANSKSIVLVNVSGLTNAELGVAVAALVIFDRVLAGICNDSRIGSGSRPNRDKRVLLKGIQEMFRLAQAAPPQQPFPQQFEDLAKEHCHYLPFRLGNLIGTSSTTKGSFNLQRSIGFTVHETTVSMLVHIGMFLSYMLHHFGKRMKENDAAALLDRVESSGSEDRKVLLDYIVSLPGSVQRILSR